MLPYALAIVVGLSSSVLFVTAFFLPDIHRQDDFFWSGVGLFYALVLWFCATSIGGAVLLGQLAVVALLTAYFWQVIKLRKAIANPDQEKSLDNFSVVSFLQNLFKRSPVISSKTDKVKTETTSSISTTNLNEILDSTESPKNPPSPPKSVVTTPSSEIVVEKTVAENTTGETLETSSSSTSTIEDSAIDNQDNQTTETTIVEEETNWDDETDEIPTSSIKVIEDQEIDETVPESVVAETSFTEEDKMKD